ncbi:hypothetical protein UT300005_25060 [Clostridium sp. CTA-5]
MEVLHKLKIDCPYEILKIEDIKIFCKPNEHGHLYLKCLIDDSINFKYSIEALTEDKIILYEELENGEKSIIFNGIIQDVKTTNNQGIYFLELEASTSSFNLDIEEKTRSFQDGEMSYDDLINEILKDYSGYVFTQCMDRPMSIGKALFQYRETDYQFLKRVASQLGLELICDIINSNNMFYFGRPDGKAYELNEDLNYKAHKDLDRYYKAQSLGIDFHDTDFFYYEVKDRKRMNLGDKIYFKQKELYVNQYIGQLYNGELIYKYRFCRKKGIWQDKIHNSKIKGVSLEGKVLEVSGEKVKLHLSIDKEQNSSKAAWFTFAPPTGNIMYAMPIVNESAMLYFPSDRATPIVTACVRKNGSSCEKLSNTDNRHFSTESGNSLDILPGAINFSRNGLNVNLNDKNGISLTSNGNLSLGAYGDVSLSGGSVSINARSKIIVQKSNHSYISIENELYNEANAVFENGRCRETFDAFTDDDPQNGVAEALLKRMKIKFHGVNIAKALLGAMTQTAESMEALMLPDINMPTVKEGTRVKYKAKNGQYFTGRAKCSKDSYKWMDFVPDNKDEYEEANKKKWVFESYKISEEDMKELPDYDPITRNRTGARVKKKASNGQYFAGRTDEFGYFIADDSDAYLDADSYGNLKCANNTLNKINDYTYKEWKSSKEGKRATLCNSDDFKLYVDVLQYEGSIGIKLNLADDNMEFSPSLKVGTEISGKLIDFPYEFKEIQAGDSKYKVDGSVSLMNGDAALMFDNGELEGTLLGSFGRFSASAHEIENGIDNSGKVQLDLGGIGFEYKKDIINGNGGFKTVDGIGGGIELESKKDTD